MDKTWKNSLLLVKTYMIDGLDLAPNLMSAAEVLRLFR